MLALIAPIGKPLASIGIDYLSFRKGPAGRPFGLERGSGALGYQPRLLLGQSSCGEALNSRPLGFYASTSLAPEDYAADRCQERNSLIVEHAPRRKL